MNGTLHTERLSVGYGDKTVVSDIALSAVPGQILCLIGPNGAGKSTLLKTLLRLLPPTAGAVYLEGKELRAYSERELAKRSAAMLTGRPEPELMKSAEVVAAGRYPYTGRLGILSEADRRVVRESMEKVGVSELADTDFTHLSDGQRQRVLLARALCQEPRLLILDEPTSYLDIRHKLDFLQLLRELVREQPLAVVMSMHELELAQRFADRLLCICGGRVDRAGCPEEIFSGGYIERLYGLERGSYDALAGTAEAGRVDGAPQVFVIGGGGSGVPVYRLLQRLGIPFAAGVLPENDLDTPTAKALAARVITDRANEPVSAERVDEALKVLQSCEYAVCTTAFGSVNRENRRLSEYAQAHGMLRAVEDMERG
jgi:iron complex transport system ATP-binding protein